MKIPLFYGLLILMMPSCQREADEHQLSKVNVIPRPEKVLVSSKIFELTDGSISAPADLSFEAHQLVAYVEARTGITLTVDSSSKAHSEYKLEIDPSIKGEEEYVLDIKPSRVTMKGKSPAGVFYALQTFSQLLPVMKSDDGTQVSVPCLTIRDKPRFQYRGMHLDVSRHFFDVTVVKRYLDMLARYKLNHFHWHLTDDQGWRVQVDAYPKLNSISSWREETLIGHHNDRPWTYDGERHGGFYTKAEIREVIAYAADRHITVVPEIEMPGHSQAVLAAYPEFGCTGNDIEVRKVWSISEDVLCPHEETFKFLEDVLTEVIELFPGKYIHIGGDECPKTQWEQSAFCQDLIKREGLADEHELQSWFVQRIERFINSKGRIMIGWDEILEGGLAPNAIVMSWRGNAGGIEAAKQEHDVIMTPTTHVYLDYYQSLHPEEPPAIGGFLPLEKVYSFEPIPEELTPEQHKYILGAQANVWTEYISTPPKLDYMTWPRGIALAEVVWTKPEQREFGDFAKRLESHLEALAAEGIFAANHLFEPEYITYSDRGELLMEFETKLPDLMTKISVDGEATWHSVDSALSVERSALCVVRSERDGEFVGRPLVLQIDKHLAAGKSIALASEPAEQFNIGGIQSLVNGIHGNETRYIDREWRGFSGTNMEAIIDLGEVTSISGVGARCFHWEERRIYLPTKAEVSFSKDGVEYAGFAEMRTGEMGKAGDPSTSSGPEIGTISKVTRYHADCEAIEARYVKVVLTNPGKIPEGMPGASGDAMLFVDEIVVK